MTWDMEMDSRLVLIQQSVAPGAHRSTGPSDHDPNRPGSSTDAGAESSSDVPAGNRHNTSITPQMFNPRFPGPNATRFMTALHVFQLAGPETAIQLVNAQPVQPSHALAQALAVPFDCIEAVHVMPTRPFQFPELAIPAIVQRSGDVPIRSTDRLILIDTVYHRHPWPNGDAAPPTVVRTVHCIGFHVIRPNLLMAAGVFHYCNYWHDLCSVTLDGRLWEHEDHAARPVQHGPYVLIDIPAHEGFQVDTQHAAQVIEQDGEHGAITDLFMSPLEEDDHMQLTQYGTGLMLPTRQDVVPLFLHQEAPAYPRFHSDSSKLPVHGAVLQPKAELNPMEEQQQQTIEPTCPGLDTAKLPKLLKTRPHASAPKKAKQASTTRQRHKNPDTVSQPTGRQSKLADFFQKSAATKVPNQKTSGQAQITDFVISRSVKSDPGADSTPSSAVPAYKLSAACAEHETDPHEPLGPREAKCSQEQTIEPPSLLTCSRSQRNTTMGTGVVVAF